MADIVQTIKKGSVIDATSARFAQQYAGDLEAGEDLAAGGTCVELRAGGRNGKLFKCGTAGGTGVFCGIVHDPKKTGQPGTIFGIGTVFHASDDASLTVGALYYVSDTPGRIATAAGTKDAKGAFLCVSATELQIIRIGGLA